jgi:hypothetical protein
MSEILIAKQHRQVIELSTTLISELHVVAGI